MQGLGYQLIMCIIDLRHPVFAFSSVANNSTTVENDWTRLWWILAAFSSSSICHCQILIYFFLFSRCYVDTISKWWLELSNTWSINRFSVVWMHRCRAFNMQTLFTYTEYKQLTHPRPDGAKSWAYICAHFRTNTVLLNTNWNDYKIKIK